MTAAREQAENADVAIETAMTSESPAVVPPSQEETRVGTDKPTIVTTSPVPVNALSTVPSVASKDVARSSTAEAAKTFKFSGIAIKPDKLKPSNGSSSNLNTAVETKTRQEKLQLWRAQQQLRRKQAEAQQFLASDEDATAKKPLTLWRATDDDKDDKDNDDEDARMKREAQAAEQRQREQQVVEEVDPLDAYMAGLVDEAAIQQSIVNPAANVISLDEIEGAKAQKVNIYGTFLPQFSADNDSETPADDDDDGDNNGDSGDREAREERELQEFMRALKEQREQADARSGDDGKDEDGPPLLSTKSSDTGRIYQGIEEDAIGEGAANIDTRSALEILQEAQKKKEIKAVDHSQVRCDTSCRPSRVLVLN